MKDIFRFTGEDGSLGYRNGKVYLLEVELMNANMPTITTPKFCPYSSWESFLDNWERV